MTFSIKTDEFLEISSPDQSYSTTNRQLASKQTFKELVYLITRSPLDMGNGKGKNKGKGRGKKRSRGPKENKIATKVATMVENKVKFPKKHHCDGHAPTWRCLRLGHVVQCPTHTDSFPQRLEDCVQCISAERRLVQQERKEKMK